MITGESQNGWFRAVLSDHEDGVLVVMWARASGGVWRRTHGEVLDYPMHMVRDQVCLQINSLRREVVAQGGKVTQAKR